ncbi:MAG: hypothetical protein ACFFAS_02080 [Promethearchaeota archaeon]
MSEKEFKVNDCITLKLEDGKTNIYINDKMFQQFKYLVFNIPIDDMEEYDEIYQLTICKNTTN